MAGRIGSRGRRSGEGEEGKETQRTPRETIERRFETGTRDGRIWNGHVAATRRLVGKRLVNRLFSFFFKYFFIFMFLAGWCLVVFLSSVFAVVVQAPSNKRSMIFHRERSES